MMQLKTYFIKRTEFYQIPHSGKLRLNKSRARNLDHQSLDQTWWKTFAFLDEEERSTIQRLLASDIPEGWARTLVLLERIKQKRLKFWVARKELLLSVVCDSL